MTAQFSNRVVVIVAKVQPETEDILVGAPLLRVEFVRRTDEHMA